MPFIVLPGKNCSYCCIRTDGSYPPQGPCDFGFDPSSSTTFKYVTGQEQDVWIDIGNYQANGFWGNDTVVLDIYDDRIDDV